MSFVKRRLPRLIAYRVIWRGTFFDSLCPNINPAFHDTDEEEEEEEEEYDGDEEYYGGIRGLFFRMKDWCEDVYEVNEIGEKAKNARDTVLSVGSKGARVAWVCSTTLLLVALPLLLEVQREQAFVEMQKQQIQMLKAQGYSDHQLAAMGLRQ